MYEKKYNCGSVEKEPDIMIRMRFWDFVQGSNTPWSMKQYKGESCNETVGDIKRFNQEVARMETTRQPPHRFNFDSDIISSPVCT